MSLDTKLLFYGIWGIGVILVYGVVLLRTRQRWKVRRDKRAQRDLIAAVALFLAALAASLAIFMVLFGPLGVGVRGFFSALALGAFFAAGLVMATDSEGTA
jgi:Ni/Fe-hydrogenase subunit HybB-like protein